MYNLKSQTKEPLVHKTVLLRPKGKKDDRVMTKMTIVMMMMINHDARNTKEPPWT